MLDLKVDKKLRDKNAKYCKERGITLPTYDMLAHPEKMPSKVKDGLKNVGLWDLNPLNLYRISWKNEPKEKGGTFGETNHLVLPRELTGTKANILVVLGKYFPTGAHKVGATYGCIAPRLVTGQYDPQTTKAVWPSTGNFCRGGAYVSALLGCHSIAILPEEMSKERFEWLKKVAGEIIATPGCESNVKEIFDKCWELRKSGQNLNIFNQFEELGNPIWHYNVTGRAVHDALKANMKKGHEFSGYISSSGSGGTLAGGYYLKDQYPKSKIAVAEALQCPTILMNGFGGHRIEGIGDKHVPWIHDCKNTDFAIAVDDNQPMRILRLFNEKIGKEVLAKCGISKELISKLDHLGISGIANVVAAIKFAKYNELTESDWVATIATDSMALYGSRLSELSHEHGAYTEAQAYRDLEVLMSVTSDHMKEMNYYEKKAVHNLKYFTWIEQQGRELKELNAQWEDRTYWKAHFDQVNQIDELITEFNDCISKS